MSPFGDIAVVLLAAGLSRRFGSANKLEQPLDGKPLALHAAETIAALPFGRKFGVCAAAQGVIADHLAALGFTLVVNPAPARGQGTSLALGAATANADDAEGVLVCLADMPHVGSRLLGEIVRAWDADRGRPVAAQGSDYLGSPALFPRALLPALMRLEGDRGARYLLVDAMPIAATPAELRDYDLPTDFDASGAR